MDLRDFAKRQKLDALSSEALSVATGGHPIKDFPCFFCNVVPFATADEFMGYISEAHIGDLGQNLKAVMPEKSDEELEAILPEKASSDWIQSFNWCTLVDPLLQSTDADNAERVELLDKIKKMFEMLRDQKILSVRHMEYMVNWSMINIQKQGDTELLNDEVAGTIECIRFLLAPHLNGLLKFLEEVIVSSGVYTNNMPDNSVDTNVVQGTQETPWLFLDQNWLILDLGEDVLDALIDWLYVFLTNDDDHRDAWRTFLGESRQLIEIIQMEFSFVYLFCTEKLRCSYALAKVEDLLLEKNVGQEELEKYGRESLDGSNNTEKAVITKIIPPPDREVDGVDALLRKSGFGLVV